MKCRDCERSIRASDTYCVYCGAATGLLPLRMLRGFVDPLPTSTRWLGSLTLALICIVIVISLVLLNKTNAPMAVSPTSTPLSSPTPRSSYAPTPAPAIALFRDDFVNEYSGWDSYSDEEGSAFYANGWLYLKDYPFGQHSENSSPHHYFADFVLEVETKLVDGSDNNWQFVRCRSVGAGSYYYFAVSADGYYMVTKRVDGVRTALVEPTSSIHIGNGRGVTNLVRVECVGTSLSLSVNGHRLARLTDSALSGGDIALGVEALGSEATEVAFDNIVVSAP